jgi:diguanylate cyclase (GGDEF)-like protein
MRLINKLLLTAIVPLLISSGFATSRLSSLVKAKEYDLVRMRSLSEAAVYERVQLSLKRSREAARVLSAPSETAMAIQQADADFLYRWAAAFLGSDLDTILFTDLDGTVLARGHDEFFFGDSYSAHPAFMALAGGLGSYEGVVSARGNHYLAYGLPVYLYGDKRVGYVVTGKNLSGSFLSSLALETGVELFFPLSEASGEGWIAGPVLDIGLGSDAALALRFPPSPLENELRAAMNASITMALVLLLVLPLALAVVLIYSLKPYDRLTSALAAYARRDMPLSALKERCAALAAASDPEIAQMAGALVDMSKTIADTLELLEARQAELERLSRNDSLTRLANRRAIDEVLARECDRAERYASSLALIMADIDHFKSVNDDYGHQEGDRILKAVADALSSRLRSIDSCGRWGGEEFLIVCPHTDAESAAGLAESIRAAIEAGVRAGPDGRVLTISLGVAQFAPGMKPADLLQEADQALYRAKSEGRNRVTSMAGSA